MAKKIRADELVHARGFAESRTKAHALILAGRVRIPVERKSGVIEWELVKKPGQALPDDTELQVEDSQKQYVGRGALKLRRAFEFWTDLSAQDALAIDVGASTGGFTQVLLEQGARRVFALDVGKNQLHERLRADPRVVSVESQHVLRVTPDLWARINLSPPFDIAVTDLSFISLTKIIPTVAEWLRPGADWILLVKPQFEVGARKAPGGIVKDPAFHQEAIDTVKSCVEGDPHLEWIEHTPSPIEGGDGNREFLARVRRRATLVTLFGLLVLGLASCASGPRSAAGPRAEATTEAPAENIETPAEVSAQDLAAEPMPTPAPMPTPLASKTFGVWIDGAGLDAFAALGFLQELEKAGRKPDRVVGTGFGCWIALAWALENNGNRAEWQASKWQSWKHLPTAGLLGRLTAGASRKSLEQEVARLLSPKAWTDFALTVDCPIYVAARNSLVTGRDKPLAEVVALQFQIPALGAASPGADVEEWPGLVAGPPTPSELDSLAGGEGSWIILRTRTSADREGRGPWRDKLTPRSDALPAPGLTPEGRRFRTFELAAPPDRPSAEIASFEKRRRWLLEGRHYASKVLSDHTLDDSPPTP